MQTKDQNLTSTSDSSVTGPGGSTEIDFNTMNDETGLSIDKDLVDSLEKQLSEKKEEMKNKLYAVSFTPDLLGKYENFIINDAEWSSTEALGIKEIHKQIQKTKKEGVKNGVIFLPALALEATHYFISKTRGTGLKKAEEFLSLYKPFDIAIGDVKSDAGEIKNIEKQLAAAMQGMTLC